MTPDPVQYPVIELAGTTYEVKFRAGDVIRLKKQGIDIGENVTLRGAEAVERTLILLQAAVSHQAKLSIEELQDMVDWARVPEVNLCITEAISKVSAQAIALKPRIDALLASANQAAATVQ